MQNFFRCVVITWLLNHADTFRKFHSFEFRSLITSRHISLLSSSTSSIYADLTVKQMKEMLKARGLTVSGVKKELIERLQSSDLKPNSEAIVPSEVTSKTVIQISRLKSTIGDDIAAMVTALERQSTSCNDEIVKAPMQQSPSSFSSPSAPLLSPFSKETIKAPVEEPRRGSKYNVRIVAYGPLGASVKVVGTVGTTGLILHDEIAYWTKASGKEPREGDIVEAHVLKVRDDGKLDLSLRPIGYNKIVHATETLVQYLEATGMITLGDRSTPEEIAKVFPMMSKGEFKGAVGALLRTGAITISEKEIYLVPEDQRVPAPVLPYSGKAPRGWTAPDGCIIFAGNLPFNLDDKRLAEAVEAKIGYGIIAKVSVAVDSRSGQSKGFAHIDCFSAEQTQKALDILTSSEGRVKVNGRDLRFELQSRGGQRPVVERRDWGYGTADKKPAQAQQSWVTVYAGNLPYNITEQGLQRAVSSIFRSSIDSIADTRVAREATTGRGRGFGYIDFIDSTSAETAVRELNGTMLFGRPLRLELEGPKKRAGKEQDGSGERRQTFKSGADYGRDNRASYERARGDSREREGLGESRSRRNSRGEDSPGTRSRFQKLDSGHRRSFEPGFVASRAHQAKGKPESQSSQSVSHELSIDSLFE